MKKILGLVVLGMLLSAHKCNEDSPTSMASVMGTKWVLQSLNGKAVEVPDGAQAPWLQLAEGDKLSGNGGCNQLMGSYKIDGDRIGFPQIGSTKMFCEATMDLEKKFMGALSATDAFKIDGGTLRLMNGASEVAAFVAGK